MGGKCTMYKMLTHYTILNWYVNVVASGYLLHTEHTLSNRSAGVSYISAHNLLRICAQFVQLLRKLCTCIRKTQQRSVWGVVAFLMITLLQNITRNVLDCDQSNCSSRIIFSYTFTLESNATWMG